MDESGKTAAELCSYIDAGMPVVFWATLDFQPVPEKRDHWLLADGTDFAWKCNEHCLLLVGYDDENYWFNDPWHDHASARSRNSWWRTAMRPKGCSQSPSARKEKYEKEEFQQNMKDRMQQFEDGASGS